MTDSLHLVAIERGRGDILAFKETFATLRKELDMFAAAGSSAALIGAGSPAAGAAAGGGGK